VDISRYDELVRRYTLPYDAADTELAEGMTLRRRQSAPRLAKFPRLLAKAGVSLRTITRLTLNLPCRFRGGY